jgi:NAD(P)-dependent dehydrogenase (short-subunit alcohol dehydrogenase family)
MWTDAVFGGGQLVGAAEAGGSPSGLILPEDLRGRRAVVTGAARGIGEAIARSLIKAGADVTAVDKDIASLKLAFCTETCKLLQGDLGADNVSDLADDLARCEPIELIVNNVGVTTPHGFMDTGRREFDKVMHTNLRGPWFFTRRLIEALVVARRHQQWRYGSILFISSLHDHVVAGQPHYSASKAAVAMLTRELAWRLAPIGIRVNAISPGWIRTATDLTTKEQLDKDDRLRSQIPMGRPGLPAEVASVAIFLLSDAWSHYLTGQNIAVDGGLSLHSWAYEAA